MTEITPAAPPVDRLLGLAEIAKRLGFTAQTIRARVKRGEFRGVVKTGKAPNSALLIPTSAVTAWIDARTVEGVVDGNCPANEGQD